MANTTNLDLVKPAGTDHALISVLNSNSDKIDAFAGQIKNDVETLEEGLAYIVGNTNTTGGTLAVGQFVYVKGHSTIPNGLRKVTASISNNGSITTSNTSPDTAGGLNTLNSAVKKLESCVEHAVINANGGTKSVFVGAHGVVLLVGFLGASGGIAALVHKSPNSIYRAIDMFTGEAWSSTSLSFSTSGDNVVITNNASQVSYFSILAAGSSR